MGNCTSSCFIKNSSRQNMAKVIDAHAKLRKVKLTATAAELMLEEPGHVISCMEELKRTRRVVAMLAEEELLAGKVYIMVPIERMNRKVTDVDMEIIKAICSGKKKIKREAKVLPNVRTELREEESQVDEVLPDARTELREEESQVDEVLPHTGCRQGNYRPRTPVLEPISEVL